MGSETTRAATAATKLGAISRGIVLCILVGCFDEALESLLDNARNLSDFLILFSIAILPWLALIGLVVYGIVRLVQWGTRRGRAKDAP